IANAVVVATGEAQSSDKKLVAYFVRQPRGREATREAPATSATPVAGSNPPTRAATGLDTARKLEHRFRQPGLREALPGSTAITLDSPSTGGFLGRFQAARRTHRTFLPDRVSNDAFSELLFALSEQPREGLPGRLYPSAGSLYPV